MPSAAASFLAELGEPFYALLLLRLMDSPKVREMQKIQEICGGFAVGNF